MPIDPACLRRFPLPEERRTITPHDAMLYALSIGCGARPTDPFDLSYSYEPALRCFPTMPLVLAHQDRWLYDPATGITQAMVVHLAQRLRVEAPLPIGAPLVTRNRLTSLIDRGDKGALLVWQRETRGADDDRLYAASESQILCRADGGFGPTNDSAPAPFAPVPHRPPDHAFPVDTMPQQALIYRLNADDNPLHADPAVAASAGFPRPILHGLCTLGIAAVTLLRRYPDRTLAMIETRFTAPLLPGDGIIVDAWETGPDSLAYRVRHADDDRIVLDMGRLAFTPG